MKKILLVVMLTLGSDLLAPCLSLASTTGHKRAGCSYKNATTPAKNIAGTCTVDYGVVGMSGPAFRQVHWPDGVITQISIGRQGITIDGKPATSAKPSVQCRLETYKIHGNVIALKGDFCR